MKTEFEWDKDKNKDNIDKHGISFKQAQHAFLDPNRVIATDLTHSKIEKRYYFYGKVKGDILTVRFTYRQNRIRIIGAGYWRKERKIYETINQNK